MATAAELLSGTRERDIAQHKLRQQQAKNAARQAETDARYAASGAQEAAAARQTGSARLASAAFRPYRPQPAFAPSAAGAGRGMVNPPAVTPDPSASPLAQMDTTSVSRQDPANPMQPQQGASAALAAPASGAQQVRPGIFRQGNSFSDSAEGASAGARPAPISGQNMAAADALASRYSNPLVAAAESTPLVTPGANIPQDTGGFGLLDKGYQQRRSAMMDVQQLKPGAGRALASLLQQQEDAPKLGLERDQMAQRGQESAADRLARGQELSARLGESAADRALKSQELADNMKTSDVKRQAAGVELSAAQRMAALQGEYLSAETDAARDAAAKKLNALSGKGAPQDEYMAVGGGETVVDPATGLVVKNPDVLVSKRTGQPVQGQKQPQAAQPAPAEAGQRKAGTTYMLPNGKMGQWTPQGWLLVG